MPKTQVVDRPTPDPTDDLPTWEALLKELPDPRPYEPLTIPSTYVVADDHFVVELAAFDEALAWLDGQVDAAMSALGDVDRAAREALDAIYPWPEPPVLDDASSALALLDADATQVLPAWPGVADDTDEARGETS